MTKPTLVNELIRKDVEAFGKKAHVMLPKRLIDEEVYVFVVKPNLALPLLHKDRVKVMDGKKYVFAELSDTSGTHGIWLEQSKIPVLFLRD